MDFDAKKKEFCSMNESGKTKVKVAEDDSQVIESPKLCDGIYKMGPSELKCLVYELDRPTPAYHTFFLLKTVRHPAVVRHETFVEENGRLTVVILSSVDCMLKDLVTPGQASLFFSSKKTDPALATTSDSALTTESDSALTPMFRQMILDLCSGLEHLFSLDLYPKKIDLNDLFFCKDGPTKKRVQLLILQAQKIRRATTAKAKRALLWEHVRSLIEEIRESTGSCMLNKVDERFVQCIGNSVDMLSEYPHSWSYEQKGRYLISIITADETIIRDRLQASELKWPGKKKIPHLLELLIKNDRTRPRPYLYSTEELYDYVLLCRTTYKHYPSLSKAVTSLKDMCPRREDVLKLMETWEPLIWFILYDAIGLISSLRSSASEKSNGSG